VKLKNAHRACATIELLKKKLKNIIDLQKQVYKTCIIDLDELKQQLRMERAKLDHVVIAAAIHQWHHQ